MSANVLQIADVVRRVVFLLFLPCFQTIVRHETSKMFRHFALTSKTAQTLPSVFSVNASIICQLSKKRFLPPLNYFLSSYRYKLDSLGPVHQNQQQVRLDIHTCTSQWCYYIHDWLHKHLGTGIRLNLQRLQRKLCVTKEKAIAYGAVCHTDSFCKK